MDEGDTVLVFCLTSYIVWVREFLCLSRQGLGIVFLFSSQLAHEPWWTRMKHLLLLLSMMGMGCIINKGWLGAYS
jgi:hypothetical protein